VPNSYGALAVHMMVDAKVATQALIGLSVTPSGRLLRQDLLLVVPPPQRQQHANGGEQKATAGPRGDAGGDRVSMAAPVGLLDAGGEAHAARARLAAAQALGQLAFMCRSGVITATRHLCPAPDTQPQLAARAVRTLPPCSALANWTAGWRALACIREDMS